MQLTKREWHSSLTGLLQLALPLPPIILFFYWTGPFATYREMGDAQRLVYWSVLTGVAWVLGLLIRRGLDLTPGIRDLWPMGRAVLTGVIVALPMTAMVAWAESLIRVGRIIPADRLPGLYLHVLITQVAIWLALERIYRPLVIHVSPQQAETQTVPQESRFLRRIPPRLGDNLLALAAEDHYLRVYTDQGTDLILFRLSDAIDELDEIQGMQVHRSWWVAKHAVRKVRRDGGKLVLELINGQQVPVSRTHLLTVRNAGWPEDGS